ncbi:hypothetical protein [Paenibacillus sp. FSL R10-2771]|uniref:hypothetical protein n=3 Tax=Paenibacillus TaxID=44249 RepID=UPI0030FBE6EA
MDSKTIVTTTRFLTLITEQNISNIEKIHNQVRKSRFIGINLFFILSLFLILTCIYLLSLGTVNNKNYFILIPIIVMSPVFLIVSQNKSLNEFIKAITAIVYWISLEIFLGGILYVSITIYGFNFNMEILIGCFFSIILISFGLYFLFSMSKKISELWIQTFFNKKYLLTANLINGQNVAGRLVTITRKGDYIINPAEDSCDLLIKNVAISTLSIQEI